MSQRNLVRKRKHAGSPELAGPLCTYMVRVSSDGGRGSLAVGTVEHLSSDTRIGKIS